jgi:hypothetical protein
MPLGTRGISIPARDMPSPPCLAWHPRLRAWASCQDADFPADVLVDHGTSLEIVLLWTL